jgi:hypothetical protein
MQFIKRTAGLTAKIAAILAFASFAVLPGAATAKSHSHTHINSK